MGVLICLDVVSIETLDLDAIKGSVSRKSLQFQKVSLDLVSMSLAKTVLFGRDRDFSRLVETFVIFLDFLIFFSISIEK